MSRRPTARTISCRGRSTFCAASRSTRAVPWPARRASRSWCGTQHQGAVPAVEARSRPGVGPGVGRDRGRPAIALLPRGTVRFVNVPEVTLPIAVTELPVVLERPSAHSVGVPMLALPEPDHGGGRLPRSTRRCSSVPPRADCPGSTRAAVHRSGTMPARLRRIAAEPAWRCWSPVSVSPTGSPRRPSPCPGRSACLFAPMPAPSLGRRAPVPPATRPC